MSNGRLIPEYFRFGSTWYYRFKTVCFAKRVHILSRRLVHLIRHPHLGLRRLVLPCALSLVHARPSIPSVLERTGNGMRVRTN